MSEEELKAIKQDKYLIMILDIFFIMYMHNMTELINHSFDLISTCFYKTDF